MEMETTISLLDIRPLVPELTMICVGLIVILLDLIVRKKEVEIGRASCRERV